LLAENKYTEPLSVSLVGGPKQILPPRIQPKMGIKELTHDFPQKSESFLLSLMYYYGVVTWSNVDGRLQIPNKLVKDQFFDRLQALTMVHVKSLFSFFDSNDPSSLQNVLRKFSKEHFSTIYDVGVEDSLKARLIALLVGYPGISTRFRQSSERKLRGGKYRADIFMESLNLNDKHQLFEVKSIPLYWLEPSQFGVSNLNDLFAKEMVAPQVAEMGREKLLKLCFYRKLGQENKMQYSGGICGNG